MLYGYSKMRYGEMGRKWKKEKEGLACVD
jgi:hypothetical protein